MCICGIINDFMKNSLDAEDRADCDRASKCVDSANFDILPGESSGVLFVRPSINRQEVVTFFLT